MMRKHIIPVLMALLFLLPAGHAAAAITSATAAPATRSLNPDRTTAVRIVWNIRTSGGVNALLETGNGEFLINGVQQSTLQPLPSQTRTSAAPVNFFTFTFTETINVPVNLIRTAVAQNQPLVFRRIFTDNGFNATRVPAVIFTFSRGGIAGALNVTRLRLAFDNGAPVCNVAAGDDVTVMAYVDSEGSGTLRGNWQVREQGVGSGFRTLRTVQMPVQGGRNVSLKSPPLPVDGSGRLDVRFDITSPQISFTEPVVTCAVSGSDTPLVARKAVGQETRVIAPQPFMPLDGQTQIEWQAVESAKAYRIEILAEEDGEPVAAQQVKADTAHGKLSPLVLEKLNSKRRYFIRVYAE